MCTKGLWSQKQKAIQGRQLKGHCWNFGQLLLQPLLMFPVLFLFSVGYRMLPVKLRSCYLVFHKCIHTFLILWKININIFWYWYSSANLSIVGGIFLVLCVGTYRYTLNEKNWGRSHQVMTSCAIFNKRITFMLIYHSFFWVSLVAQIVMNLPTMQET